MTAPLVVLAFLALVLGFLGTPAWPWFQHFIEGVPTSFALSGLLEGGVLRVMSLSTVVVFAGLGLGWWFYGRAPLATSETLDPLERLWPNVFTLLRRKYFADEIYEWAVVRFTARGGRACDWLDRWLWNSGVQLLAYVVIGISWLDRLFDEYVVNLGFDQICARLAGGGRRLSKLQTGRVQSYLRLIGLGLTALVLLLIWGCRRS